jgi:hypothetical protein
MQAIRGRDGILEIKKSMLKKTLLNSSAMLNKHTVTDKKRQTVRFTAQYRASISRASVTEFNVCVCLETRKSVLSGFSCEKKSAGIPVY